MGFRFPERPVLFYPSLARAIGSDEALLFTLYHEHIQLQSTPDIEGNPSCILARQDWLAMADFWDEERLAVTTNSLVSQGYILAAFGQAGAIRISLIDQPEQALNDSLPNQHASGQQYLEQQQPSQQQPDQQYLEQQQPSQQQLERQPQDRLPQDQQYVEQWRQAAPPIMVQELPVVEQPPERNELSRRVHQAQPQVRGPAPTFGGSIGWSKSRPQPGAGNIFASRLDEIEQKNQKLHVMFLGWRPSKVLFEMLPRHNIPADFAEQLLDEFVLYWLDKDRKESNWDQKFLAWVKREWVKKQTRDGREKRFAQESNAGVNHENPRTDTREKRKRVTAAIMDIQDTDW
ncbi:MAG: DnaT-like ssDNA-binding domain-containing protein [Amphritea sp.]